MFIDLLNKKEGHQRYRLPTEMEWQYASQAGEPAIRRYFFAPKSQATPAMLAQYAWFNQNTKDPKGPRPVGQLLPNAWGLFDIYGNVSEWTIQSNPNHWYGSTHTDYRYGHGGDFTKPAGNCNSWERTLSIYDSNNDIHDSTDNTGSVNSGFRLILDPEPSRQQAQASSTPAKPSFDCSKASTPVELAICSDTRLSEIDANVALIFKEALSEVEDKNTFRAEQRQWLVQRDRECTQAADIKLCLAQHYVNRLKQIEAKVYGHLK
jgi:uncharacterized protein YecT (DUF1311 family)